MVYNVQPIYRNMLRTYACDQYDASGRQLGTLRLYMRPTGVLKWTPMVDNMRVYDSTHDVLSSLRGESIASFRCFE